MNKHRILNLFILTILVIASSFSAPIRSVIAQSLSPIIAVFIENNHIIGFHWPVGTILTLTIDDPSTPGAVDYTATSAVQADTDPNVPGSTSARFWPGESFQVKPGHIVTLSGGGTTKIHTVTNLTRDGVDMPGDRLWGHADPGTVVEVRNRWQRDIVRWETADSTGYWEADFSKAGDLPEEGLTRDFGLGDHFMILQNDNDGDHTQVDFVMPFPDFEVRLTQNIIEAWNFPLGYPVTLTINDPLTSQNPDFSVVLDPEPAPWNPSDSYFDYELGDQFRIRPGHLLTMSNGFLTKTHMVSALQVTDFDYNLDTICGTAEPGLQVETRIEYDQLFFQRYATVAANGNWCVDYAYPGSSKNEQTTYDLLPFTEGTAHLRDGDNDSTQVTWPYYLNAWVGGEHVDGNNWLSGDPVTLEIDDLATVVVPDYGALAVPEVGPWFLTGVNFPFAGEYDLKGGDIVTLSQGGRVKQLIASSSLALTSLDYLTDTIVGTATPNAHVLVNIGYGQGYMRFTVADPSGNWSAAFSIPGDQPGEEGVIDLLPGMNVMAAESDADSDQTNISRRIPAPVIRVRLTAGEIYAQNYLPGYPVTLEVFRPGDPGDPVYSDTKVMGADNLIIFDYPDNLDIGAGYFVRTTDGEVVKEHTVTGVWINSVDRDLDKVYGDATAGSAVTVVARSNSVRAQRDLVAGGDDAWTADFSVPGAENWEQDVIDLDTAYIVFAYQTDDDNDITWVHWMFNQPPVIGSISGPVAPVPVNTPTKVSGSFTDPDMGDTHSVLWNWGDGIISDGDVDEGNGVVSGSHIYSTAGIYTVQLTLCDAVGECDEVIYQYIVVYDPAGGFVTGGGWIWSPVDAYKTDPMLEGKATFGFVSKYLKGANVPSGNTEFQFKAGDLNFKSTSYQWLVVNKSGNNAQFKGYGTINGSGKYGFMLWATDGSPDTFRIKIWIADDETNIVYDNGTNQPIGGGSIVVHTK